MLWDIPQMVTTIGQIVNKFVPDRDQQVKFQAELEQQLVQIEADAAKAQADINNTEASNPNLFVSGWRPSVGWVCALAFAWQFVGQPFFSFFYTLYTKQPAPVVLLPSDALMTVLLGLLGLGGYRSLEKIKGVTK
jgi:Holin of 3TMs, for gene-transfer release